MPYTSTDITTKETEAQAIARIAREAAHTTTITEKVAAPLLVKPASRIELESLEKYLSAPTRARANVQLRDEASFIDYVRRHKRPGTEIFAEVTEAGGSFTAVLDYHVAKVDATTTADAVQQAREELPQWGDHVCKYVCEFTPEWKRWFKLSGDLVSQSQMALFIEDNIGDITQPVGAAMLEIVKTLEATQGAQFKSAIRLDNGDRNFGYTVQTGAKAGEKGELEIPQKFTLSFPIFTNGLGYDIECRFRWNVDGGNLRLGFEIVKPHKLIETALTHSRNEIEKALGLTVLLGSGQVTK